MLKFFQKPYRWAAVFSVLLLCAASFVLLDSFVIPKALTAVEPSPGVSEALRPESQTGTSDSSNLAEQAVVTDYSYADENIQISIETVREDETTFYVADIILSDPSYLKTALAGNTYGRNIKESTSAMAEEHDAIFAINGDYYGFRDTGYVLRNGVLYRDSGDGQALVMDSDGNLSVVSESEKTAQSLMAAGAWQVLSFGPALVENGEIAVDEGSEVTQSMNSNPRTAIGQISERHYLVIVSDGRTNESKGLSLLQLADKFSARGCTIAYNLDGGGSSTMVFNGKVVNNPVGGRKESERGISDIVYIGYA